MAAGFQTQVNVQQTLGVPGDFASSNPRAFFPAGPGGLVAGPAGVTVGVFAWARQPTDGDGTPAWVSNQGNGAKPSGFVHRAQQGLIITYLAQSGVLIQPGFAMDLQIAGDVFVKNSGSTQALYGQKAFANYADGTIYFAAAGTAGTSGSVTGSIAARTAAFTGSVADDLLTVTAVSAGTLVAGMTLSGTGGGGLAASTKIAQQVSGTAGGVGVYALTIPGQTVTSTAITGTVGLLTVTAVASGALEVGDVLSGTGGGGVTASTVISQVGNSLVGGTGTFWVDPTQTVTSTTITVSRAIETDWYCHSSGLAGETVKMSTHAAL